MKKANDIKPVVQFADRIKQTLTATYVPTYDWMYELGLSSSQLGMYAYIFNICKTEPQKEHYIKTQNLAKVFNVTTQNVCATVKELCKHGYLNKRVEGKGNVSKPYYSIP